MSAPAPLRALATLYRDSFAGLPRRTWLLCFAGFVNRSGSMVVPFLSIYTSRRFGFTVEDAGFVVGLYGLGAIFGSLLGGWLCDRLGPVRVQIATLGVAGLWMMLLPLLRDPTWFALAIVVLGLLADAFRPGSITAAAASVPPALRRRAMSLNRLMMNAGWAFGPTIGGFLIDVDARWLFVADGGTCLLAATFLAVFLRGWQPHVETTAGATAPSALRGPFRDRYFLLLMAANLAAMVGFMQYFTTGTRYFENDLHLDGWTIGVLLAINPVMILLFEMPVVHLLRARSPLPTVALGSFLYAAGYALLLVPELGITGAALAMVVVAIGELLQMPMISSHINDHAPAHARGAYNGVYGMCFCLGLVIAPSLGGFSYERGGPFGLWAMTVGLTLLAALGFLALHRRSLRRGSTEPLTRG